MLFKPVVPVRRLPLRILLSLLLVFGLTGMVEAKKVSSKTSTPAKELFGHMKVPAQMKPQPIGSYAKGCLAGAERLPANGSSWQAMRLSRNRYWGHPELIAFIEKFARTVTEKDNWPGLLVGDLSQPRGGPMMGDHASHQIGMDVDIWLNPMPNKRLSKRERENISAVSTIKNRREINPKVWTTGHAKILRRAALDKQVARIFINPAIKKEMCKWSKQQKDRSWLRKLRPWYGHHYHFHVRLKCPKGASSCKNQNPPPPGTGCGKELAYWLSDKPYRRTPPKPGEKIKKKRPIRLADLPKRCVAVLNDPGEIKQAAVKR
jgi:penicillin-insensitive murein DD-endopeptidase